MPFNAVFSWWIKKRMKAITFALQNPFYVQEKVFNNLLYQGKKTSFGFQYNLHANLDYTGFIKQVPLHTYQDFYPFIEQTIAGEKDVVWPGAIQWFSKSSGTTNAKSKLIPVTMESILDCHYKGGKDLLSIYHYNNPNANLFSGKHLILGGSTELNKLNASASFGDLSAIIIKNLPFWTEIRRTPSKKIALMSNWDKKMDKMASAVISQDVRILAGVPSWTLILLQEVLKKSGKKTISEVWPNLQMYMHGGVNFEPYKKQFDAIIDKPTVNYYQTYNASEGFFGIQLNNKDEDMLLLLDHGIFYEFIPMDVFNGVNSPTIPLKEVKLDVNYALVISTNGGLWRYIIGDTVKFTSLSPFKIKVTGRTSHFINAFGEEVIVENTDKAIEVACEQTNASINDYTVAPIYLEENKKGAHEWFVEFDAEPNNMDAFITIIDNTLKELNSDYEAKRSFDFILQKPRVNKVKKGVFNKWLESKNKMGGQNKIPRLSNNRIFVEEIKNI